MMQSKAWTPASMPAEASHELQYKVYFHCFCPLPAECAKGGRNINKSALVEDINGAVKLCWHHLKNSSIHNGQEDGDETSPMSLLRDMIKLHTAGYGAHFQLFPEGMIK